MAKEPERYEADEARRRTEAALRAAFQTPHKTYEESKIGKRKRRATKSLSRRKPVNKKA